MIRRSPLRMVSTCAIALGFSFVLFGCPGKKETPDAGPVATATPEVPDTGPTQIAPLEEPDAGQDAGPAKPTGPGINATQAKVAACCRSLRARAKELGTSPEASQLLGFATQCDGIVKGLGNSGPTAPELVPLKGLLKTVQGLPAGCTGF